MQIAAASTRSLAILLHGVGASGADLVPLGRLLGEAMPQMRCVAPDAPHVFDQAPVGRQWFSLDGIGLGTLGARVADARAAFDATLRTVLDETGFFGRLDRVALVGFSQGAIMALDAIATGRWAVAAVIGFAGMLAPDAVLSPAVRGAQVLLVHGEEDPVIPAIAGRHAAAVLREAGAGIGFLAEPGLGHEIGPDGIRAARAFLAERLGTKS